MFTSLDQKKCFEIVTYVKKKIKGMLKTVYAIVTVGAY